MDTVEADPNSARKCILRRRGEHEIALVASEERGLERSTHIAHRGEILIAFLA